MLGDEGIIPIRGVRIPTSFTRIVYNVNVTYFTICFTYGQMNLQQQVQRTHDQFLDLHRGLLDAIEGSDALPPLPQSLGGTDADQINLELYLTTVVSTMTRVQTFTQLIFFLDDTLQDRNLLAPLYINGLLQLLTSKATTAVKNAEATIASAATTIDAPSSSSQIQIATKVTLSTAGNSYNDDFGDIYSQESTNSGRFLSIANSSDESKAKIIKKDTQVAMDLESLMLETDCDSWLACSTAAQKIVDMIQPHREQLAFRAGIILLLAKQVRLSLGVTIAEVGPDAIRCFLPDDPMRLAVMLWKGDIPNWHVRLEEQLMLLASNAQSSDALSMDDDSCLDILFPSEWKRASPANVQYDVTNVCCPPATNDFRVFCTISSVPIELYANARCDMYMSYLLEYMAELVGKDNLFKRSLLLIKGWWLYEASTYIGCVMKHYLSDTAISLMICIIFNMFHISIQHPIQALTYFLKEFSQIDWEKSIITLDGIIYLDINVDDTSCPSATVSLDTILQANPPSNEGRSGSLLPADFLARIVDEYYCVAPMPASYNDDNDNDNGSLASAPRSASVKSSNGDDLCSGSNDESSIGATPLPTSTTSASITSVNRPLRPETFQMGCINILNPFSLENVASLKLDKRRAKRVSKAILIGAKHFLPVLKCASSGGDVGAAMDGFYRSTLGRFGSGWRPDVWRNMVHVNSFNLLAPSIWDEPDSSRGLLGLFGSSGSISDRTAVRSNRLKIYRSICYYNFIVVGMISNEAAIYQLSKEILYEKGPLPVGEIGKSLQDLSSTMNLSSTIKEYYGGLKKVLEKYPEDFILFTDHPFNPHVFLRKFLETDELGVVSRGIISSNFIGKLKKKYYPRKTKAAATVPHDDGASRTGYYTTPRTGGRGFSAPSSSRGAAYQRQPAPARYGNAILNQQSASAPTNNSHTKSRFW